MKRQSETKPISADSNRLFFRRLASWQAPRRDNRAGNDRARGNGDKALAVRSGKAKPLADAEPL
jgi:hypothetical protein